MKRFHVHLHVDDLARSVAFYARLFAAEPTRAEAGYAKWMLEDPPLNFAISTRGDQPGIDHLGIQTDDPAWLAMMKARAEAADLALLDEGGLRQRGSGCLPGLFRRQRRPVGQGALGLPGPARRRRRRAGPTPGRRADAPGHRPPHAAVAGAAAGHAGPPGAAGRADLDRPQLRA